MSLRKEVTDFIVSKYEMILPGDDYNPTMIRTHLDSLSEEAFDQYIRSLAAPAEGATEETQEYLPFVAPNLKDPRIVLENLFATMESMGHPLEERLWLTDPHTGTVYLTPQKYPVIDLMVRRQAQMLTKKTSIPANNRHVDELTGQVTGASKGSQISFPEQQSQLAQGLEATLLEEVKVRGGDRVALAEYDRQLIEYGDVSLADIGQTGTLTSSTSNLAILLRAALLDNNIDEV